MTPPAPTWQKGPPLLFTSVDIMKDGAVKLGKAVHKNANCVLLKRREVFTVSGAVTSKMRICPRCEFVKD